MADKKILKSSKLAHVLYDIRGPIMDKARQMEAEGKKLIKLNIGNLAVFGFDPPEEVMSDMITNLPNSAGYSDSKGIFAARKAVMHYTQLKGIEGVTLDDIYLGNGASDLISMAAEALLNEGDELLVPMPDYPLWTAVTSLAGATPVHYLCDESKGWIPSIEDIRAKVTPRTKGIVIINPNNPTGVVYSAETLTRLAELLTAKSKEYGHNIFLVSDEPYRDIAFDGKKVPYPAAFYPHTLTCFSFSKSLSLPGERLGYVAVRPGCEGEDVLVDMMAQISRFTGHNCPPSIIQKATAECLDVTSDLSVYETNMNLLYDKLTELGFEVERPGGTFYIFPKALEEDANAFCLKAREFDLLLVPSDTFGVKGYVRFAYCIDTEKVKRSLPALEKLAAAYKTSQSR